MKIFSRNTVRSIAFGGVLLAALGSTAAYAGGSTSTKLSNGVLSFEAHNGREIGQSSSKIYFGEKYKKTGGSSVYAKLTVIFEKATYKDQEKLVKNGQTISYSGSAPVSYAPDCSAVGLMWAGGQSYETPYIKQLC